MRIKITYIVLIKKLKLIGFSEKRMLGSHLVLVNEKHNLNIVVPRFNSNELVAEYFFRVIKKNLLERGVVTEEQFYNLMMGDNQ